MLVPFFCRRNIEKYRIFRMQKSTKMYKNEKQFANLFVSSTKIDFSAVDFYHCLYMMRPLRGGCSLQLCKAPRRRVVYRWNELREKSFVVRKHYICFCVFVAFIITVLSWPQAWSTSKIFFWSRFSIIFLRVFSTNRQMVAFIFDRVGQSSSSAPSCPQSLSNGNICRIEMQEKLSEQFEHGEKATWSRA